MKAEKISPNFKQSINDIETAINDVNVKIRMINCDIFNYIRHINSYSTSWISN
jgi:hypothetical protein